MFIIYLDVSSHLDISSMRIDTFTPFIIYIFPKPGTVASHGKPLTNIYKA